MTLASEMAGDIAEILADLPASFAFAGASHNCTCSPVTRGSTVDPDGILQNYDLEIACAVYVGDIPPPKRVIQVTDAGQNLDGVNFVVVDIVRDPAGLLLKCRRGAP